MNAKRILVLGSGLVARPCLEYLLRDEGNEITVACRTLVTAQTLSTGFPRTTALALDVTNKTSLDIQISKHDLVISLVPYAYHVAVIRSAITAKVNVVTTSYISPAMMELEAEVKEAGIVVLNEVGLDPGIDHLYAVKLISEVHAKGGKVKEFHSYCGGLPAPEHSDNPLRFKFSWSPKGALMSQDNAASFLLDGKRVDILATELMETAKPYKDITEYDLVAYPNRDSTPFQQFYKIPEAETVVRGSLRYEGNPEFVQALKDLGFFNTEAQSWLKPGISWAKVLIKLTGASSAIDIPLRIPALCMFESKDHKQRILSGLQDLGLFEDKAAPIPTTGASLLDVLSTHLADLLSYEPGERDLVVLQHKFVVEYPGTSTNLPTTETITSTLSLLGDSESTPGGCSAMARTVGVTCGIAAQLVLDDRLPAFRNSGIWAPYEMEMAEPIRAVLEKEGIRMIERIV